MERLSWELIQHLQRDSRINVTALIHRGKRSTSPVFVLAVIPRALWAARKADVIHLGDPMVSIVGWLIRLLWRRPVAVTVHGLDVTYQNQLYRWYLALFFHHFQLYLPISRYVKSLVTKRPITGAVRVINPNIDDRYYAPDTKREDLRALLKKHGHILESSTRVVGTSGRLVKRKGHAWFITQVLPHLDKTTYLVAGNGPEKAAIQQAITQAGVTQRVVLLGRVNETELSVFYNAIDAFVQPNQHVPGDVEGFGLVLLEAAACNRSVLAANVDGIPDAIQHNKNGLLLAPGNAHSWIQQLHRIPLIPEARTYTINNFTWPRAAKQYREVLLGLS